MPAWYLNEWNETFFERNSLILAQNVPATAGAFCNYDNNTAIVDQKSRPTL